MSSAHIPFIKLTFGNKSFSWKGEVSRPDYFTRLCHKRYTEEANTLTVNLAYCPQPGENPNALEDAIVAAGGECLVQYGDLGETSSLYKGLVHSYKVGFEGGVLVYNLSLISAMVCYTYEQYPGCELSTKKGHTISTVVNEVRKIVEQYMSFTGNSFKSYIFDEDSSVNFKDKVTFTTISVPSGNPIAALKSLVRQLKVKKLWRSEELEMDQSMKDFIIDPSNRLGSRAAVARPGAAGSSSRRPVWHDPYEGVDHSLDYHLALEIDESGSGMSCVKIVLVSNDSSVSATYTFEWGDKNSEVLSWSPEYDGLYSITKARGSTMFETCLSVNENGDYGYTTFTYDVPQILENGVASDLFAQVENLRINQSEIDRHYEYKATLTVLGKSKMMDLGISRIKVIPIVAGSYHHTAGEYVVIGVEDNVSSEGFTTTYTLYKASSSASLFGTTSKGTRIYFEGEYVDLDDYNPEEGKYSSNTCPISTFGGSSTSGVFGPIGTDWVSGCYSGNFYLTQSQMESNAAYIWYRLKPLGWTMNAVAGMLGNMEKESTINPGLWQSFNVGGGPAFGLVQWDPFTKYTNWCANNGLDPADMDSALMRIEYEIERGLQWIKTGAYPETFAQFKSSTKNVTYLANAFLRNYERPANQNQPDRAEKANKWYLFLKSLPEDSQWLVPCSNSGITSPFGDRIHPIDGTRKFHNGVDLGAGSGTPIIASRSGTVKTAMYYGGWGNYVEIDHGGGFVSLYAHMTKFVVSVGQKVPQGCTIGYVGSTGASTGPHLHFTIYKNGNAVNPEDYVKFS